MTETSRLAIRHTTAGDAAVDGLWSGALAGLLMAAFVLAAGLAAGDSPAAVLGRFDPGEAHSAATGALLHIAASAVYGVLFGLAWRVVGARLVGDGRYLVWAAGLVFGLVLFGVAEGVIVPGAGSLLKEFPQWQFALAHVLYGAALGFFFARAPAHIHSS